MTDVVPSGPLSLPFAGAAKLLAACESFRAAMTPAGEDPYTIEQALARTDYPESTRDGTSGNRPDPPLAVLTRDDGDEFTLDNNYVNTGTLLLSLLLPVPDEYLDDKKNALLNFCNQVGEIFLEALQLANTPDGDGIHYWNLVGIRQTIAPAEVDPTLKLPEERPWYGATFELRWQ